MCVYTTLGSYTGGVVCACAMAVLNMDANFRISEVYFSPRCGIGIFGGGFLNASVMSAVVCVTSYSEDRLGSLFCAGKISVVSYTRSEAVLGM